MRRDSATILLSASSNWTRSAANWPKSSPPCRWIALPFMVRKNSLADVSVDFQGALNSQPHKRLVSLSSSWMPRSYVAALAPGSTRTQDLVLPLPWTHGGRNPHRPPATAPRSTSMPRDQNVSSSFWLGSAALQEIARARLMVQSQVQFEKARVSCRRTIRLSANSAHRWSGVSAMKSTLSLPQ